MISYGPSRVPALNAMSNAQIVISDLFNPQISRSSILKCNKAHAPGAQPGDDFVRTEARADREGHQRGM